MLRFSIALANGLLSYSGRVDSSSVGVREGGALRNDFRLQADATGGMPLRLGNSAADMERRLRADGATGALSCSGSRRHSHKSRRRLARFRGDSCRDLAAAADQGLSGGLHGMLMLRWGFVIALAIAIGALEAPAAAVVYEVGEDGMMSRIDTDIAARHPTPHRVRNTNASSARSQVYRPYVAAAASQYEVSPALIDAIAHAESRYDQRAVSPVGAAGIMQLMPATARALGVDRGDASANIRGGTAYLRQLLDKFDGDVVRTIAAYNAGPAAVVRARGVPRYPETIAYVSTVLDRLADAAN